MALIHMAMIHPRATRAVAPSATGADTKERLLEMNAQRGWASLNGGP